MIGKIKETAEIDATHCTLEKVAELGAQKALERIGIRDEEAGEDIRELRSLLSAFRIARRTAWQAIVKVITVGSLGLLVLGFFHKIKNGGE